MFFMTRIQIHVERGGENDLFESMAKTPVSFIIFMFGIFLGMIISFELRTSLHLTNIDPGLLVGAVAESSLTPEATVATLNTKIPAISIAQEEEKAHGMSGALVTVPETTSSSVRTLQLLVTDKEIAITRLNDGT